ncbi:MAG: DUF3616 domain-containing protein, partial [Alphaproteobacteria bacterium]
GVAVQSGLCDASAAVALDPDHFVVADDERNVLQVYRRGAGAPVEGLRRDLSGFLGTKPGKESDIEGAARLGDRVYWITSHGTNEDGEVQKRRHRLFATTVDPRTDGLAVVVVGRPYSRLVDDLVADRSLRRFHLRKAARTPPKGPGGLAIEGLAATPDGDLLIGFRNPVPDGMALLVELKNPRGVVAGKRAKFGRSFLLDLDRRGIRSIERVGADYLIIAGPIDDERPFALYRWSGIEGDRPRRIVTPVIDGLQAEALFEVPGTAAVQVLSDDGRHRIGGIECKALPPGQRAFRAVLLTP